MTKADLEKQHETGLIGLLSNECVPEELRVYAAVLLYKRGSRFLGFQEYQPYKERVIDYILNEYAATPLMPFAPTTNNDMAGRLHSRMLDATQSVAHAHVRIDNHREQVLRSLADHDQEFGNHAKRMANIEEDAAATEEELEYNINLAHYDLEALQTDFDNYRRKVWYVFAGTSGASVLVSYLIHHFLR